MHYRLIVLAGVVVFLGGAFPAGASTDPAEQLAIGKFLVAKDDMLDPNFARTVVLLLTHGEDGTFGVVLNRPSSLRVSDVLADETLARRRDRIFLGGPVAPNQMLFLLHTKEHPEGCTKVLDETCTGGSRELLEQLLTREGSATLLRLFAGYAGWARGQLEWELEQGGWHVFPGNASMIFEPDPGKLWPELIERTRERLALVLAQP